MTWLEQEMSAIAERYGLTIVYAFGSRAPEIAARLHGQGVIAEFPNSDVDIAVQPERGHHLNVQERVRLATALEDLFGVSRVDLVILPEANAFLAVDVIRGELLFCNDLDSQAEDELYISRRAGDLAHFENVHWTQTIEGRIP
jgi:predicted nucleotidyltransferase